MRGGYDSSLAHLQAMQGWTTEDPEILRLADENGWTVAHEQAARGWKTNNSEILALRVAGNGKTVEDYIGEKMGFFHDKIYYSLNKVSRLNATVETFRAMAMDAIKIMRGVVPPIDKKLTNYEQLYTASGRAYRAELYFSYAQKETEVRRIKTWYAEVVQEAYVAVDLSEAAIPEKIDLKKKIRGIMSPIIR
jgi:hypothetical protein